MISVIIPCFNQGRFLTDCLESLALQTVLPGQVIVVNDGSTDQETNDLCARLPHYDYPFPLTVLVQEERGLPAARNEGIRRAVGDVIVPLDGDDTLLPSALEDYGRFLAEHPDIDVCYPDIMFHGNVRYDYLGHPYNRWRHTQHNWLVRASAIRRRVFDAGYRYDEDLCNGYEDWDFWLRTCALGPFRAAALGKVAFAYRRWGFTMFDRADHGRVIADIRRRHETLGIWSADVERALRTREAPDHCWFSPVPVSCGPRDGMTLRPAGDMEAFLNRDTVSRFVWFGGLPEQDPAAIRFIVGMVASNKCSPFYVFIRRGEASPYLVVLDRLAVLEAQRVSFECDPPVAKAVLIETAGERFPWPVSVREEGAWPLAAPGPLSALLALAGPPLLPADFADDPRTHADMYYYFRRDPAACSFPRPGGDRRVLAVAVPDLAHGRPVRTLAGLLEGEALRSRFDGVYLVTAQPGPHPAHVALEPLADGIFHLGPWGLKPEGQTAVLLKAVQDMGVSDLLIVDCARAFAAIRAVRAARLPVRVTVAWSALPDGAGERFDEEEPLRVLAARYATLVDRAVAADAPVTEHLVDLLYFPRTKLRTLPMGPEAPGWDRAFVDWLFPQEPAAPGRQTGHAA